MKIIEGDDFEFKREIKPSLELETCGFEAGLVSIVKANSVKIAQSNI